MIATAFIHVAPQPASAFVAAGRVFGFFPVQPANDHVAACPHCAIRPGSVEARQCSTVGCPIGHGRGAGL